jgi:hypothetical protein
LLGNITGEASVIDIFDNETPLNTNQQIALITLDNRSKTIRVKNQAEQPTMNVDIVNIPAFCLIKPNEDNFLNIGIANPTTNSLDVTVAFKQPNQVNLDWTKQTFSLKPNERSTAKLKLTPKSNEIFKTTDNFTLDCTIQINQAVAQTAQILCRPVTIVTKDTPAVFILDKHEQITSTVVNEPNTRHLFWKGKDDLSAVLTISKAGNDILLKAVVKDDIHNSTEKDDAIWKGDSIQVVILPHNNNIAPWVFGFALDNDNSTKSWGLVPHRRQAWTKPQERAQADHPTRRSGKDHNLLLHPANRCPQGQSRTRILIQLHAQRCRRKHPRIDDDLYPGTWFRPCTQYRNISRYRHTIAFLT